MVRTQIQLTEAQYHELKERLRRRKVSLSAAVREAVDLWLRQSSREDLVECSIASLGKFRSGKSDISERHDEYLAEAFDPKDVE
jgi:hypothetical protein